MNLRQRQLYHGERPWPLNRMHLSSLLSGPVPIFSEYIPDFTFMLHDLTALSDDELKGAVMLKVMQLLFKHIRDPDILEKLPAILSLTREVLDAKTGGESLVAIFKYLIHTVDRNISENDIKRVVEQVLSEKEGELMMTLAEKIRMEGREEGWEEGREEGEVIGKLQLLHEILNEPVPSKNELRGKPIEILREMLGNVEKRWMMVKSGS